MTCWTRWTSACPDMRKKRGEKRNVGMGGSASATTRSAVRLKSQPQANMYAALRLLPPPPTGYGSKRGLVSCDLRCFCIPVDWGTGTCVLGGANTPQALRASSPVGELRFFVGLPLPACGRTRRTAPRLASGRTLHWSVLPAMPVPSSPPGREDVGIFVAESVVGLGCELRFRAARPSRSALLPTSDLPCGGGAEGGRGGSRQNADPSPRGRWPRRAKLAWDGRAGIASREPTTGCNGTRVMGTNHRPAQFGPVTDIHV